MLFPVPLQRSLCVPLAKEFAADSSVLCVALSSLQAHAFVALRPGERGRSQAAVWV